MDLDAELEQNAIALAHQIMEAETLLSGAHHLLRLAELENEQLHKENEELRKLINFLRSPPN